MPTLNIEGKKVKVDDSFLSMTPEQQADAVDEIAQQIGLTKQVDPQESEAVKAEGAELARIQDKFFNGNDGTLRNADSFVRGAADTATFGMADEIAALGDTMNPVNKEGVWNKITAAATLANPVSNMMTQAKEMIAPSDEMKSNLIRQRAFQTARDDMDPYASTTGRITGALTGAVGLTKAGAPFMASLPSTASLAAKTAQSAKAGALYSGLYGLGTGEDPAERVTEGVNSALTGAALGAVVPTVATAVGAVVKPFTDAVKGYMRPGAFADAKIAERLSDAGMTTDQAAAKIARDPSLTLADIGGKSTRSLLRTTTNIPGKAQDYVVNRLNTRQLAQGDRVKTIIRETFADPEKFEMAKSKLFEIQAKTSQPLYEKALTKQNVWNERLQQFIDEPIMKRGINQGLRIQRLESLAENKPFQPEDFAIVGFNEAGDAIIGGVPNMRTINVVKKGLDAMLEGARHPITGRLTEEGRAIDQVRRAFLGEVDRMNPDYAVARKHYASFMQVNDAMEFGKNVFSMSPATVTTKIAEMTPMEKIAARVGAADAMRKTIDEANVTNNALLKLFGSRQKVKNLEALYSSKEEFAAARRMVFDEVRKRNTYDAVKSNSTTARQLADMAEAGGLRDTVDFTQRAVTQGPVSATLQFVGSRLKMLGGFTPRVAEETARKLLSTDPKVISKLTFDLSKIEKAAISADEKRQLVYKLITPALSGEVTRQRLQ